ncbi:MAG: DUF3391 domain-containing protein [Nitrospira sp.]|nr:DUF3391 domain-containing protein [Nitrospira sp.]
MASTKRISIDQLTVGMFIAGLDQPWYRTPFLRHKWLVSSPDDILQLKQHGIQAVTIDIERGLDVGAAIAVTPSSTPPPVEPPPASAETVVPQQNERGPRSASAAVAYREATAAVERVFSDLEAGHPPQIVTLKPVVSKLLEQIVAQPEPMLIQFCLDKVRRFDATLANHGMDVCVLTLILAVENGCAEADREALGLGALLHDIGYLRLPRNLYRKSTPLTDQEQVLMKQHPQLAATVLAQVDSIPDAVSRIILQHHEYQDGSGFPQQLKQEGLSTLAQLVGLADTYDELVSARHGRPPLLPHDAIRQLFVLGAKGRYDKTLVEVAIKALGVYPLGSLIKLNTNECAVVVGLNHEDRLRPRIRIIRGPGGEPQQKPTDLDLQNQTSDQPTRTILRALDPTQEQVNLPEYLETTVGTLSQ